VKNSKFDTNYVKTICENKLNIKFRKGRHFTGWFVVGGTHIAPITVAMGRKPIPRKTYQTMARQLKLTAEQFDGLLECPIKMKEYMDILRKQNLLPEQTEGAQTSDSGQT